MMILFFFVFVIALVVLMIGSIWKVFTKAGKPGWACIVPIYNVIVLLEIAGKPWWWILLMIIPLVNIVIAILLAIEVAKKVGHSSGFGLGRAFLPFLFSPVLGYGSARYQP